jgi:hypothetical protein
MGDMTITCIQCEQPFLFTVAEQERFLAMGFDTPRRCPECREKKVKAVGAAGRERKMRDGNKHRPRRYSDDMSDY